MLARREPPQESAELKFDAVGLFCLSEEKETRKEVRLEIVWTGLCAVLETMLEGSALRSSHFYC